MFEIKPGKKVGGCSRDLCGDDDEAARRDGDVRLDETDVVPEHVAAAVDVLDPDVVHAGVQDEGHEEHLAAVGREMGGVRLSVLGARVNYISNLWDTTKKYTMHLKGYNDKKTKTSIFGCFERRNDTYFYRRAMRCRLSAVAQAIS